MKLLCFFALITLSVTTLAGGFTFPNVAYDHASVYLFNTGENAEKSMPEFSVYRNGVYALSKLGNGQEWTDAMNTQMNMVFRPGVDAMVSGLSGCYIPRHGIIYFDKTGKPVASISICFECMRIHFWSTEELPEFSTNFSEKAISRAEKQFADLENVFTQNGIPVFKMSDEYRTFAMTQDSLYSNNGEIIFDYTNTSAFGTGKLSMDAVKAWITKPDFKLRETQETRISHREHDTSRWEYTNLISNSGTKLTFSSSAADAVLTEAVILNPEIRLPNGISTGMSLEQVQNSFIVWDGIAYPSSIIVNYSDAIVRYQFKHRTLVKIEVVMI